MNNKELDFIQDFKRLLEKYKLYLEEDITCNYNIDDEPESGYEKYYLTGENFYLSIEDLYDYFNK